MPAGECNRWMDGVAEPDDLIAWLRAGGPWGAPPVVIETHGAIVFLTGTRAFKMKKAVSLGYLDFSTLASRRVALERELVLNRRTAPAFYLGLLPVVASGRSFALGGDGPAIEWILEMRRFPEGSLLNEQLAAGKLTGAMVEALARQVARFHQEAPAVSGVDWVAAVDRIARENADDLVLLGPAWGNLSVERIAEARRNQISLLRAALEAQSGEVRHCHGDLHLGNVFLDDGAPTLFDCIEFSDFYAQVPPLYDLSFLLMDLVARGQGRLANRALNAWVMAHDPSRWTELLASLVLLPCYVGLRAEIRAKTEARRPGGSAAALHYLEIAGACGQSGRARLIAVGGLSGTGKSTLARALAHAAFDGVGAVHLRSDEIRKRLAGVETTDTLPPSSYTLEASQRVYAEMYRLCDVCLRAGVSVVVDAVFSNPGERQEIERVARDLGVPFRGLWLDAPASLLEARIRGRQGDASDADVRVLRLQLSLKTGPMSWERLDASGTSGDVEQAALVLLRETPSVRP